MDPLLLILFVILIFLSAFFSGSEIALMTVSNHTIQSLLREKRFGAASLQTIKSHADRLLITILIGNNVVNVAASTLATALTLRLVSDLGISEGQGIAVVTGVITLIILIFGEIAPKAICARYNVAISLIIAPLYRGLMIVLYPVTILIEYFIRAISLWIGGDQTSKKITHRDLEAFVDMSHKEGDIELHERRRIKNLLSLQDMTAESVMTPRVNVDFLSLDITIDEACESMLTILHSRFPVYTATPDDTDFVLTMREAFRLKKEHPGEMLHKLSLEKIMKVPITLPLDDLFMKFQKSRRHIALVVDEYGGTAGIVTMEDILEEIFGDIQDESDEKIVAIKKYANGGMDAIGSVLIDDILEEYDIHYEDLDIPEEYLGESLSYILMAELENFPKTNEQILFTGKDYSLTLQVSKVTENVIEMIRCELEKHVSK